MVDISAELKKFRESDYGRDVKSAFVSAFEKFVPALNKVDGNYYAKGSNMANISADNAQEVCQNDIDNLPVNTFYVINPNSGVHHIPTETGAMVITFSKNDRVYSGATQIFYAFDGKLYFRSYTGGTWKEWHTIGENENTMDADEAEEILFQVFWAPEEVEVE